MDSATRKLAKTDHCAGCGMITETPAEYHPWAACTLFKVTLNSEQVRGNLRAVVEYGMKAEKLGISLDEAMSNIAKVR